MQSKDFLVSDIAVLWRSYFIKTAKAADSLNEHNKGNERRLTNQLYCLFECGYMSCSCCPVDPMPENLSLSLFLRITTTVACNMDLTKYPMDKQTCTLQLESCKDFFFYTVKMAELCSLNLWQGADGWAWCQMKAIKAEDQNIFKSLSLIFWAGICTRLSECVCSSWVFIPHSKTWYLLCIHVTND